MKLDTLSIHGGFAGDSINGATAVPICQTVSYAYKTAQELADVFHGKELSRRQNESCYKRQRD